MAGMTMKQVQNLLQFLGYYDGIPDNDYGPKTYKATLDFQIDFGGIAQDGKPGEETQKALRHAVAYGMPTYETEDKPETGDFWVDDPPEHFEKKEFRCPCGECDGFPVEPQESMVRAVNEIRRRLGVPVTIVRDDGSGGSGVRCAKHNAEVGGVANSQHLTGIAADLNSSKSPEEMYRVAEEVLGDTGGIGLYSWGIHVDTRPVKARWDER